jgi:hypothetical protein
MILEINNDDELDMIKTMVCFCYIYNEFDNNSVNDGDDVPCNDQ